MARRRWEIRRASLPISILSRINMWMPVSPGRFIAPRRAGLCARITTCWAAVCTRGLAEHCDEFTPGRTGSACPADAGGWASPFLLEMEVEAFSAHVGGTRRCEHVCLNYLDLAEILRSIGTGIQVWVCSDRRALCPD